MTTSDPLSTSFAELAQIATEVALLAGRRVFELRREGVEVAASKSSVVDIVTAADQASERLIVEEIQRARPHDGILGEEGTGLQGDSGITWVIDPIDGTVNYLYDLPAYAVSIAATVADPEATADGRRAVAAAVFNPRTDELFDAWEGGGARMNGQAITASGKTELATTLIGTGFGYTVERRTEQAAMLSRLLPAVRDIRRIGSAAYDLCLVGGGRLDAFFERGLQPWDYAAGVLVAREAGAMVLGRDDATPPGEPLLVVAADGLAQQIRSTVLGDAAA